MNFYKQAALALDHLEAKQGSVKGSLSAAGLKGSEKEGKRVLALVIETLKYKPVLLSLATSLNLLHAERKTFPAKPPPGTPSSRALLLVLLHDLLFSAQGKIQAADKWPPKAAVMKHGTRLKAELVRVMIKKGAASKEELRREGGEAAALIPRYVRVNSNRAALTTIIEHYTSLSPPFTLLPSATHPLPPRSFYIDAHLPDVLLAFSTGTSFAGDEAYTSGQVILQDKASCFPAKVLMHEWSEGEGSVIDATAAPGNKTSYVSALMGNKGTLHAFELSPNRFKVLNTMLERAGCTNTKTQRADFLQSDPAEYADVTRILLDPSCSGSGIVNRLDYLLEDGEAENELDKAERLDKLAGFQLSMIQHAMTFPSAQRIVYSTCSVHKEEDEDVVRAALGCQQAKEGRWKLAPRESVLPKWERRGLPGHMPDNASADALIRCVPGEDRTNGFFVSCFIRQNSKGIDDAQLAPAITGRGKRARSSCDAEDGDAGLVEIDGGSDDSDQLATGGTAVAGLPLRKRKKKNKKKKKEKKKSQAVASSEQS